MLFFAVGFGVGIILAIQLGSILLLVCVVSICAWAALFCRQLSQQILLVFLGVCFGTGGTEYQLHQYNAWHIPAALINQNTVVQGNIVSIPNHSTLGDSFLFRLQKIQNHSVDTLIRVSWYGDHSPLYAGEQWQFGVRLKPPHGLQNFGGFNSYYYFLQQGIQATATVVNSVPVQRLAERHCCAIARVRQKVQQQVQQAIKDPTLASIVSALVVGSRANFSEQQWWVLQRTGTNHLVAIAGLHIGFVAMLFYFCIHVLWRCSATLVLRYPAPQAAAIAALLGALGYSLLSGMSLPAQRAIIMLSVILLGQLFYYRIALWRRLVLAFLLILVWQPFVLYSASFWLSFVAVAWIGYGVSGRLGAYHGWRQVGIMQWVLFLGLLPMTLLYFQQVSLVMLLANIIAIPWVGFVIIPISLFATFLLMVSSQWAQQLFWVSGKLLAPLWSGLCALAQWPFATWNHAVYLPWILLTSFVAMGLLLAPRGWSGRWLGVLWLSPLLWHQAPHPAAGEVWFTLLDVGQGLASVVQTQRHVLVYDAGPHFPGGFDAGLRVVLPYLQYRGISKIDTLMISHGDNDHIGGAQALLQNSAIEKITTSVPQKFLPAVALNCLAGQQWQWDGVHFQVLYPPVNTKQNSNNGSCVLRVSVGQQHLLLTGDIEKAAEQWLVTNQYQLLPTQVVVAPHHGSKTSSMLALVQAMQPRYALFATGFYNRYHFPSAAVVQRYTDRGAVAFTTAAQGAIFIRLTQQGQLNLDTYSEGKFKK